MPWLLFRYFFYVLNILTKITYIFKTFNIFCLKGPGFYVYSTFIIIRRVKGKVSTSLFALFVSWPLINMIKDGDFQIYTKILGVLYTAHSVSTVGLQFYLRESTVRYNAYFISSRNQNQIQYCRIHTLM